MRVERFARTDPRLLRPSLPWPVVTCPVIVGKMQLFNVCDPARRDRK